MATDGEPEPGKEPPRGEGKPPEQKPGGGGKPPEGDKPEDGEGEPEEDQGPPLYKRPIFWIVGGIVLAVAIVGGLLWWLHARQYATTDDAFIDAHIVRLAPEVSGKLIAVADVDNRHVVPGQLLAVIEPSAPEAQIAQTKAEAAQAAADVRQNEARVAQARAQRAQAAANARAPAADAVKARADLARYLALQRLDAAAVAATQIDQARASARSTAAQAAAAQRETDAASANIRVARRQVDSSRAAEAAALARVSQAQVTVNNLRLTAPVAGQVVNRMVNIGSYVAPGQQIMAIVPDRIWVTANFKETQLQHMRRGQHVDIRIDAFPDVEFEGHVDSIQRGAGQAFALLPPQNATGNYVKVVQRVPVRILFDGPLPRRYPIGPGMSVVPRVKVR